MSGKKPLSTQERAKGTAYAQILYILGDRTRTFSELMNCLTLFIKTFGEAYREMWVSTFWQLYNAHKAQYAS